MTSTDPRPSPILTGIALALTVTRWLLPAEATAEGDTLWIALLWFLLAGAYGIWRFFLPGGWHFDRADLAAALLIGGHVVSGGAVLAGEGNHRAAFNLIWEWLSLGVLWIIWRDLLQSSRLRAALTTVMLATAVMLSLWGLWQYVEWYPRMQRQYGPLFDELRRVEANGGNATALLRQLHEAGIPTERGSRDLFENRLRSSHEPFGPFALANTFGGLLAAWLVLGCSVLLGKKPKGRPPHPNPLPRGGGEGTGEIHHDRNTSRFIRRLAVGLLLAMVAICLYLTNSRTAWAGALAAGAAWGLIFVNRRIEPSRGRVIVSSLGVGIGALASAGLLWIVMQDERVVPGPLKSLSYRAEYWVGTWRMLKTTPWLGVGPGQFRDNYLQFKLPETSEEIADPHNLVLDVWSNGGLLALAGLVGLLFCLARRVWSLCTAPPPAAATEQEVPTWRAVLPGWAGFAVAILGQLITLGYWDNQLDQMAVFSLTWLIGAGMLRLAGAISEQTLTLGSTLAALALSIHLCGAGGIAMPAVTQTWLLLILLTLAPSAPRDASPAEGSGRSRVGALIMAVTGFAMAWGCFSTSYWPVMQRKHLVEAAELAASRGGDQETSGRLYRQASEADDLAWEAWESLAMWEFAQAQRSPANKDRTKFEAAIHAESEAIRRAPYRPYGYQLLADFWSTLARQTRRPDDWNEAVTAYRMATDRHPTSARLQADFAITLAEAGHASDAAQAARRAMIQDDLNHRRGHADRYLPQKLREQLAKLADTSPSDAAQNP